MENSKGEALEVDGDREVYIPFVNNFVYTQIPHHTANIGVAKLHGHQLHSLLACR